MLWTQKQVEILLLLTPWRFPWRLDSPVFLKVPVESRGNKCNPFIDTFCILGNKLFVPICFLGILCSRRTSCNDLSLHQSKVEFCAVDGWTTSPESLRKYRQITARSWYLQRQGAEKKETIFTNFHLRKAKLGRHLSNPHQDST